MHFVNIKFSLYLNNSSRLYFLYTAFMFSASSTGYLSVMMGCNGIIMA